VQDVDLHFNPDFPRQKQHSTMKNCYQES